MLAGYAVWLGGATIIAVMTPVQLWTLAGALLLVTLIVVAFVSGRHAPEHDV
jgi:steroid 5-alpha reductase family enzyme